MHFLFEISCNVFCSDLVIIGYQEDFPSSEVAFRQHLPMADVLLIIAFGSLDRGCCPHPSGRSNIILPLLKIEKCLIRSY